MAEKKEAFGLSLLDVLSNALLGGIVLMMIAAVSVSVSNMQSELDKDNEQGNAEANSAKQFEPIDKAFKGNSMLIFAFRTKGGDSTKCKLLPWYDEELYKLNKGNPDCINFSQGLYNKNYWVITREMTECSWQTGTWKILIQGEEKDLPDTIFCNINIGVRPINSEKRVILKSQILPQENEYSNQYWLFMIDEKGIGDPSIN